MIVRARVRESDSENGSETLINRMQEVMSNDVSIKTGREGGSHHGEMVCESLLSVYHIDLGASSPLM
jgi:hypothetical protein